MAVLSGVEPQDVMFYFEEICKIPHGSGNTEKIADYIENFAREKGLEYNRDEMNNVVVVKAAAKGREAAESVIVHGHIDMVCEKAPHIDKNMELEGLDLEICGDEIYAKGTTLGADDAIAVSMMLALLAAEDISHPRLEAVFTSDEEIGMLGAAALNTDMLKGKVLINIDSEDEGVFTVGCAGGNRTSCTLPVVREDFCTGEGIKLSIGGLKGGHSGVDINRGRANANVLMGRLLYAIEKECPIRICSLEGGLKDNVIPQEARAVIAAQSVEKVREICGKMQKRFADEYSKSEDGIKISCEAHKPSEQPMNERSTRNSVFMLMCMPCGVTKMSLELKGEVESSLNMGIVKSEKDFLKIVFCVRSSLEEDKRLMTEKIEHFAKMLGGKTEVHGDYPGWEFKPNSKLLNAMKKVFYEQYGYEPKIETIHAGVECGIFQSKINGLDCISLGPMIKDIHTYRERMSVNSVCRVWKMLKKFLNDFDR